MALFRLNLRYKRYKELFHGGDRAPENVDIFTYRDVIITQMAAMLVESEWLENYTVKVYLRRQKRYALYSIIDEVLSKQVCVDCDGEGITVYRAIKVLRDKFLCHLDNFEDYDTSGREGISLGKWTPGDRLVLTKLLMPYDGIGPIDELVKRLNEVVVATTEMGKREIIIGSLNAAFNQN